jgi:hypothetical protein
MPVFSDVRIERILWALLILVAGAAGLSSCNRQPADSEVYLKASDSQSSIPRYALLEVTFEHNGTYANKFFEVSVEAVFTSPTGKQRRIKGFYYGGNLWKLRFRPDETGRWRYSYTVRGEGGFTRDGTGAFDCTPSNADGPVIRNPHNPFRFEFASGKGYFPIGLQDCTGLAGGSIKPNPIDGGGRAEGGRQVAWDEYADIYGRAGFNLLRFSPRNCSFDLYGDLRRYPEAEAAATDAFLAAARQHGLRVMFGFLGNYRPMGRFERVLKRVMRKALGRDDDDVVTADDRDEVAKQKRFIDYCIARWGAYVDFWELLNERDASNDWTTIMADYVHSADPEHRLVSTSFERPGLAAIDINAPHWYETEDELKSDLRVRDLATRWKKAGKPVIVGEQGNSGMNWDSRSALRMRIRTWTALFEEISLVFWNTSWSKQGMHLGHYTPGGASNIYLGPEERGYIHVLSEFSSHLDAGVRMTPVEVSAPELVRGYGLVSDRVTAVYLHHAASHSSFVKHAEITVKLPSEAAELRAEWIDPATGRAVAEHKVRGPSATLKAPPFEVDLALLISAGK